MIYLKLKRIFDVIFSIFSLISLSPVIALIIIAIKLESKGSVFFRQERIGINKITFTMLKFRTMKIDAPKNTPTHLLKNPDLYITKIGKILRRTSLDELPQLWNILVGDMSLIGPRPALWNQADLIRERDKYQANGVRPGLTGWAQINGRDELPIEIKSKLDGEYVERLSFLMDFKCFYKTIIAVIQKDGIIEGKPTVKKTKSNKEEISK